MIIALAEMTEMFASVKRVLINADHERGVMLTRWQGAGSSLYAHIYKWAYINTQTHNVL